MAPGALLLAAGLAAALATAPAGRLDFGSDTEGRIAASVYSLPPQLIAADQAAAFLAAVRRARPERTVVAFADEELALPPGVTRLPLRGRAVSPWPRDPFSLATRPDGGLAVVARPNLQPGREADAVFARALIEELPPALARAWGEPSPTTAAVPFHNGQALLAPDAVWITLHTVEPRALALLGLHRVPVEDFTSAAGAVRYLAAVQRAAAELGDHYGRPVRFVHPPPGELGPRLLEALGGGAGFDLDSLVTLLPVPGGGERALVADLAAGSRLAAAAPANELAELADLYRLQPRGEDLRRALIAAHDLPRATRLDRFLDLAAEGVASHGLQVTRLPILLLPTSLLGGAAWPDFLIGWNNVVVETVGGAARAEGFASGLSSGDDLAREGFAAAGVELTLLPPLAESVVRGGGYRCASNHWRPAASQQAHVRVARGVVESARLERRPSQY